MKETSSNGRQILSDGCCVWVNNVSGESIARLGAFGATAMIDIHLPLDKQKETGRECLDCRHDLTGANAWKYFVSSLKRNFAIEVDEVHRPDWAKEKQSGVRDK